MSTSKRMREHIEVVSRELNEAGIPFVIDKNRNGHVVFKFYRHGKSLQLVCSSSGDRRAIKNSLSCLRKLLAYGSANRLELGA